MYYLCLTQTVNANSLKTKRYSLIIKEMCVLGCHLGWVNMRFCIQKGGSQSHGNKSVTKKKKQNDKILAVIWLFATFLISICSFSRLTAR